MDLTQHLKDLCLANAEIAKAGIEAGRREGQSARDALRTIIAVRDLAPDEMLPTPLMLAIEAARKVIA